MRKLVILVSVVVLALAFVMAAPAFAAKGGQGKGGGKGKPGNGGTIELVQYDTDGVASFQEKITFTVSTTATDRPWVHLTCNQGGTPVLEDRQGFFPTALGDEWFYLGPTPAWQGGDATCTAFLEKYKTKGKGGWEQLASTTFPVVG